MINIDDLKKKLQDLYEYNRGRQADLLIENIPLKVYGGFTENGFIRVSFASKTKPPVIKGTKLINIESGTNKNFHFIFFEIQENTNKEVFISFIEDVLKSSVDTKTESDFFIKLKDRFTVWKSMFVRKQKMDESLYIGLFGELLILKKIMIPKLGISNSIQAWGGPDDHCKDFTFSEKWIEVKTTSTNSNSIKISSLSQLSGEKNGYLSIVSYEKYTIEATTTALSLYDLVMQVYDFIPSLTDKKCFIDKLSDYGYDFNQDNLEFKLKVHSINFYEINSEFPRLTQNDILFPQITKISYELNIDSISCFKVKESVLFD